MQLDVLEAMTRLAPTLSTPNPLDRPAHAMRFDDSHYAVGFCEVPMCAMNGRVP